MQQHLAVIAHVIDYRCECHAPSECKWRDDNKGSGTLSESCCNGKYKTCTSTCQESKTPVNATCSNYCTGCNIQVCTAWTCNNGYTKSNNTCVVASCPSGYTLSSCPANGTCSKCQSGSATRYRLDSCKTGYNKNALGTACVEAVTNSCT